jgi:hypothetical protein
MFPARHAAACSCCGAVCSVLLIQVVVKRSCVTRREHARRVNCVLMHQSAVFTSCDAVVYAQRPGVAASWLLGCRKMF